MLLNLTFFVKLFLVVKLAIPFATGFYPITVRDYATVSQKDFICRFNITDWLKCIKRCLDNPNCLSYNYHHRPQEETVEGTLCELYKCGLDQSKDFIQSLVYSQGNIFQQLKVAEANQFCKESKSSVPSVPSLPHQSCRNGWVMHGTSCYFAEGQQLSWEDAKKNCQNMNSILTPVLNQEQNEFIVSLSREFTRKYIWIGLHRDDEGFEWLNGSDLMYDDKWAQKEPSSDTSFNCVNILKLDGTWKTWKCSQPNPSICKYDP